MAVNPNPSQLDADQIIKRQFDSDNDAVRVNLVQGSATFTVDSELIDNTSYTPNASTTIVIGAEVDEVAPSSISEGNGGALRMSPERSLYTELRDAAGNERGVNVTASNELNVIATAQPGVDIGDVTINNAAGASAVNIQDGGNSITVDGSVSAVQSGTWNINNVSGTVSLPTGAATEATLSSAQTILSTRLSGALVPTAYDEINLTYVPSGNGAGQVETAVYKLASSTVKTLTLSYNSDNKLTSVIAS